jgi:hypothetical protein
MCIREDCRSCKISTGILEFGLRGTINRLRHEADKIRDTTNQDYAADAIDGEADNLESLLNMLKREMA